MKQKSFLNKNEIRAFSISDLQGYALLLMYHKCLDSEYLRSVLSEGCLLNEKPFSN